MTWTGPNVKPFALSPGVFEVSAIIVSADDPTIVPVVEPVLILTLKVSFASVNLSLSSVLVNDPTPLLLIVNDPVLLLLSKSEGETPVPSIL